MAKRRPTINVDLKPDAQIAIDAFVKRKKMVKRDVVGDVLLWFANQPDAVKRVVIGDVDDGLERAYANALRAMANQIDPQPSAPIKENWTETPNANPRRQSSEQKGPASAV